MVTLNRAVALAMVEGPAAGLAVLDDLEQDKRLARHHRLHAVRAHLLEMAGDAEGLATATCSRPGSRRASPSRTTSDERPKPCERHPSRPDAVTESDVDLGDGHVLHVYDTGDLGAGGATDVEPLVVVWHHGTPNIGAPPRPLFEAAARLGIRWVSYDRPGYGGSTPRPGRDVASAARDVAAVADHLGVGSFAVMGHSGGGTHALASGALLGDRVAIRRQRLRGRPVQRLGARVLRRHGARR